MTTHFHHEMSTPWGRLDITVGLHGRLVHIAFLDQDSRPPPAAWLRIAGASRQRSWERTAAAREQLQAYLAGRNPRFEFDLSPRGTDFQRAVWHQLLAIAPGATRTYGAVAASLGRPAAVRAVGRAVGLNPLPIVVPCHRVIGKDGTLTGFAGGLAMKRGLLDLESAPLGAA